MKTRTLTRAKTEETYQISTDRGGDGQFDSSHLLRRPSTDRSRVLLYYWGPCEYWLTIRE